MESPTLELYNALQMLYNHFNIRLFNSSLPAILFTNQRQAGIMGYFAPNRWTSTKGKNCHEIAINPTYVGRASLIELMQTLVHEMVHCWQECHGKPSRTSYHNREWASKMKSIGLMPSSTGAPGGAITGQHMSDYPLKDGKFINSCIELLKNKQFNLPWVDRLAIVSHLPTDEIQLAEALDETLNDEVKDLLSDIHDSIKEQLIAPISLNFGESLIVPPNPKKTKVKYSCPSCDLNVWGRDNLRLMCEDCQESLFKA